MSFQSMKMQQAGMLTDEKGDAVSGKLSLEEEVNTELDRLGQGGRWVWTLCALASLPNILNGFHIASYVFVGKMPDSFWCEVPTLNQSTWTHEQMLNISSESQGLNHCRFIDHDYTRLSSMSYVDALNYTVGKQTPSTVSCIYHPMGQIKYDMEGSSIVPEWDLVCENSVWRTLVQVIMSLGKCIGASTVGIMSDKYGRKILFTVGCALFGVSSILVTFSPWYWPFLIGRFLQGVSSSAIFYPPLVLMTENVAAKHRAWMGLALNMALPVGMIYLSIVGLFFTNWRHLQMALSVPGLLVLVILYFFKESPRWLLSKGRTVEAYRVVFNKPLDTSVTNYTPLGSIHDHGTKRQSKGVFFEVCGLYRTARLRRIALICQFAFFTSAFSYYATAINAANLSANPVVYVSSTGMVDILGYSSSIFLLRILGRKWGVFSYLALAASCMLILLVIPRDAQTVLVSIAMVGRLGVSAAYAIIAIYTAELFPTEVRNTAVGVSSMIGHIGSMMAPFVVDFLGNVAWYIPTTICGASLLLAAVLILLNPDTTQTKLVDHVGGPNAVDETNK